MNKAIATLFLLLPCAALAGDGWIKGTNRLHKATMVFRSQDIVSLHCEYLETDWQPHGWRLTVALQVPDEGFYFHEEDEIRRILGEIDRLTDIPTDHLCKLPKDEEP